MVNYDTMITHTGCDTAKAKPWVSANDRVTIGRFRPLSGISEQAGMLKMVLKAIQEEIGLLATLPVLRERIDKLHSTNAR